MAAPTPATNEPKTALPTEDQIAPVTLHHAIDEKQDVHIKDEAGEVAQLALASGAATREESKAVLRKIDLYILPIMCITYGLQFLDKTSLSYSSVFGIIADNHLVGQNYAWVSSIFYFGYLFAEYPGVTLMQKLPLAKFLGTNIMIWASIMMITASCSSFGGLATVRFLLGVFEATISPGFVAITAIWWTREEQILRSCLWITFNGVFSCLGGLLTFGIGHISGSLSPWKYIYLILGAITFVWGGLFIYIVPDNPSTARWLTPEQKVIAVQRVIENKMGTKTRKIDFKQVIEALTDPKVILLFLISFVNAAGGGGLTFGSIIIAGLGFTSLQTALLGMVTGASQTFFNLLGGFLTWKIPNSRLIVGSLAMIPPIIGTCLINQLPTSDKWARLVGVWLLMGYPVGFFVLLNLLATNVAGSTKRSTASGLAFVGYCVGQISGSQFFKSAESPSYPSGIKAMLCCFTLNLFLNLVLRVLYMLENRKRDRAIAGKTEEELAALKIESGIQGFEDFTDGQNVFFRYAL